MHRFQRLGNYITGDDHIHLKTVLRLNCGDEIAVFDNSGEYLARITSVGAIQTEIEIIEKMDNRSEPSCRITLYQSIPKADKLELIVQKCTELGFCALIPFESARCVGGLSGNKLERLRRIAYEAAKQSRRLSVPQICDPLPFAGMLERITAHETCLCAWEGETQTSLKAALRAGYKDIAVVVGCEGGFSPEEAAAIRAAGAVLVTLGPRILRTETAGMALCSIILYESGDMETGGEV